MSTGEMAPEDCAILIRFKPDNLEAELGPAFDSVGLRLRNVARMPKGAKIAIQDILTEDLSVCLTAMIRVSAFPKAPDDWHVLVDRLSTIWGVDPSNDADQDALQDDLGAKVAELRYYMEGNTPSDSSCAELTQSILDFIGEPELRAAVPSYRRDKDYLRARDGFFRLLQESAEDRDDWAKVVNSFDGIDQVPLMSIHKSKGLEFHTVIFFGLDERTWWNFEPDDSEEMRAFFVAFTRAMQRAFFTSCSGRGQGITYVDDLIGKAGVARIEGPSPAASAF